MSDFIALTDLSVEYQSRSGTVVAVRDANLRVRSGEILVVVGPSGCGKTTLLNVLAGLVRPTRGSASISGQPIAGPGRDRAVVFQDYLLFPWRNVWNNVGFGLEVGPASVQRTVDREKAAADIAAAIQMVGLAGFERHYPHQLSGGMKQRVALARALVLQPAVLLMDEPFAAIDAMTREVMQTELLRIIEQTGSTVFFITHSIDEALLLGDRVVVMTPRPGRVKEVIDVPLPKPRWAQGVKSGPAFYELREYIWEMLRSEVMAVEPSRPAPAVREPL